MRMNFVTGAMAGGLLSFLTIWLCLQYIERRDRKRGSRKDGTR